MALITLDRNPGLAGASSPSIGLRAGWLSLGRLAHAASLLLVAAVLSRTLSAAEYGQYQLVWMYLNIAIPLFLFGTPVSVSYFLAPLEGAARDRQASQHVCLILLLAALFALCAGGVWVWGAGLLEMPPEGRRLVPLAVFIGSGMIACGFLEPVLVVYGRHRILAWSLILFSAVHLMAVLAGWFAGGSLWSIFASLSCAVGLRVVCSYLLLFRLVRPFSFAFLRHSPIEQLRYVWPIGIREGIEALSRFSDKLVFTAFFTTTQFAFYFNGAWELPIVGIVVSSLMAVLLPEWRVAYRRGEMDRVRALMHFAARRLALVLFPTAALAFSVAPELMSLVFGEDYRASGDIFRVFLFLLPLRVSTAGRVLLAANRTRAVLLGTVVDLVVAVGLGLALIPWLGTLGPAVALIVSTSCQVGLYNWRAAAAIDRPLLDLLPWGALGRLGLSSITAALGASFCVGFESAVLNVFTATAVFLLIMAALGLGLRLLEAEERGLVIGFWRLILARCRSILRP